ncbi:hypothetical protein CK3_31240 [butyrate-producing bacterium SS3/4]|nr:hypothetical protein CK3_31240 [butyrate-producing bacterium SS3/4]
MLFGGSFWIRTVNKGGNAVIRPLHESAEGFFLLGKSCQAAKRTACLHARADNQANMSKQGDNPDYECWQQLRERPGGAQQQPFERST